MSQNPQQLLDNHTNELKKISFEVLLSIARAKEPLTYSFIDAEDNEHQIELFFKSYSDDELEMVVAIDSDWKARFEPAKLQKIVHILRSSN